jgi:hypothetical protein
MYTAGKQVLFNETERCLSMARGPVLVACNFTETPQTLSLM